MKLNGTSLGTRIRFSPPALYPRRADTIGRM